MNFGLAKFAKVVGTTAIVLMGFSQAAQAAPVTCQFPVIGARTLTFDDTLTCVSAGAFPSGGGHGDATVAGLVPGGGGTLIDRDPATGGPNEGALTITGVGATSGTWSVASSNWATYGNLYLYFHFGNAQNNYANNPDWFLVQLAPGDTSGTWTFSANQGLSNVALIGAGSPNQVPEPAALALVSLALLGLAVSQRRRRQK